MNHVRATKKTVCLLFVLLLGGIWLNSCQPKPAVIAPPTITNVNPVTAPVGATLVITGTNFDPIAENNIVRFGTQRATVLQASSTQLVVLVLARDGVMLSVTVNGLTATIPLSIIEVNQVTIMGEIKANTTWTAGNRYLLRGFVYVPKGVTLTIEPGTIVMGAVHEMDPLGEYRPGALIIEAGAKLIAQGTSQRPIVFTSSKPPGQRQYGDWGGLVMIGKAPHNQPGNTSFDFGVRGTIGDFNEPADNSGFLEYVRIEFGGGSVRCCTEMNALTLYGIGSGTTIDNVQVSYSGDDSFEWFGGTVNARHLVSFRTFDDDFDTDWGYSGHVQFGLALRDPAVADQSGSNCFESDNFNPGENTPEQGSPVPNNGLPLTQPIFANISSFAFADLPSALHSPNGSGPYQSALHLRRNTAASIINSVFVGWPEGLRLDGTQTGTWKNVDAGLLDVAGVVLANVGGATTVIGTEATVGVRGAGEISHSDAQQFFGSPDRQNEIIGLVDLPRLGLHSATFHLTTPGFLLQSNSPLLQNALLSPKLADSFFTKTTYRGAFGTTDWTKGWANWNPQTTDYAR